MNRVRVLRDYFEEKEKDINEGDVMKQLDDAFANLKGIERKFDNVKWIVRDYKRMDSLRQHYKDICSVSAHPLTDEHKIFIAKSIYPTNVGGHDTKIINELGPYETLEEVIYFSDAGYCISEKAWNRVKEIAKDILIKELKRSVWLLENNLEDPCPAECPCKTCTVNCYITCELYSEWVEQINMAESEGEK